MREMLVVKTRVVAVVTMRRKLIRDRNNRIGRVPGCRKAQGQERNQKLFSKIWLEKLECGVQEISLKIEV